MAENRFLLNADINTRNNKVTNVTDPTAEQDAANKRYVDTRPNAVVYSGSELNVPAGFFVINDNSTIMILIIIIIVIA